MLITKKTKNNNRARVSRNAEFSRMQIIIIIITIIIIIIIIIITINFIFIASVSLTVLGALKYHAIQYHEKMY